MASISSEAQEDMISGLPDEVLLHILSLLPIQDAIKTTLLKRFGNLWRSVPRLTFDTWPYKWIDQAGPCYDEKFGNMIHHVLTFHERAKIDELYLQHRFFFEYSKHPELSTNPDPELETCVIEEMWFAGVLDSLVSFAIIKKCKVLFLDFIDTGDCDLQQGYVLPAIVYTSMYLTQLSLGACDITSCDEVWLKSLKTFHLRVVVMSDEAMEKFLLGCPSLEELSVVGCYGLRYLCCSNNTKLKKLKIRHSENELLNVSDLNVVYLNITMNRIESVVILKAAVVDATVRFIMLFKDERRSYEGFKFLLQSLDQCKTFRPCPWSVVALGIWELNNIPCPCFSWKQLVLELRVANYVQVGLSTLLRHVPLLETLKIHVQPRIRDGPLFTNDQAIWLEEYELDEDKYWNETEASLENLKTVVLHGDCIADSAVIHVAKFLLRNAVALERMVISEKKIVNLNDPFYIFTCNGMKPEMENLLTDELSCILENLLTSPKASTKAVICYV